MIFEVLYKISSLLNEKLRINFKLNRNIVSVQQPENLINEGAVSVFLVNLERDTSTGISFGNKSLAGKYTSKYRPVWEINLYVIIASVFPKKQYSDSLKIITEILRIIQENHILSFEHKGLKYSVEPVNVSFQELSNIWSVAGGNYYPSILCKIKTIKIDSNAMIKIDPNVEERRIQL